MGDPTLALVPAGPPAEADDPDEEEQQADEGRPQEPLSQPEQPRGPADGRGHPIDRGAHDLVGGDRAPEGGRGATERRRTGNAGRRGEDRAEHDGDERAEDGDPSPQRQDADPFSPALDERSSLAAVGEEAGAGSFLGPTAGNIDLADQRDQEALVVLPVGAVVLDDAHAVRHRAADHGKGKPSRMHERTARRRVIGGPEVVPDQARPGRGEVATEAVALVEENVAMLEVPRQAETLAKCDELVHAPIGIHRVEQRREADDGSARVGDHDDPAAALRDEPVDRFGRPRANVRRLDGVLEQDRQVAEPLDEEVVRRAQDGQVAQRLEGDRPQRRIYREHERSEQERRAEAEDREPLLDGVERPDPRPLPGALQGRANEVRLAISGRELVTNAVGPGALSDVIAGADPLQDPSEPVAQIRRDRAEAGRTELGGPPGLGHDPRLCLVPRKGRDVELEERE